MSDVMTRAQRSANMSHIRGRGTLPEIELRRRLWKKGLRYRLHHKHLTGRPDLAFISSRVAVFVDGCFWHSCPKHRIWPKNRATFWREKLEGNARRDRFVRRELESRGWQVVRVWEHEVADTPDRAVVRIRRAIQAGDSKRLQRHER